MVIIMNEIKISETKRQFEYIEKCKVWLKEEEKRLGRPLTMSVNTLGCQMNARDSEKIVAILERIGYVATEDTVADLVLYNTCTVRENANLKVYGRLGYLKKYKEKHLIFQKQEQQEREFIFV